MPLKKYPYYLSSISNLLTRFENPVLISRYFTGINRPTEPSQVKLRSGQRFIVRNAMDIWSIKETFVDRFYERFGTLIQDGWVIVDVGAGLGDYTVFAAEHSPSIRVFAYEPFEESFALLGDNLRLNGIENAQVFNTAVGGRSGLMRLDLTGGEPLQIQSADHVHNDEESSDDSIVVPSLSLGDALSSNSLGKCDLLKLDCEGAEYAILFEASEGLLHNVERIVMEYHDGITDFTHVDMARFLRKHDFVINITPNYVHSNIGYLYAERKTQN